MESLFPIESSSADATREQASRLAVRLRAPWVVALYGPLGSGKTQFVKGLADGLGLDGNDVTSPTFTIVQEYRGVGARLVHVDAYRLEKASDLDGIGLEELLYADDPCVVEWPERVERLLPPETVRLAFEHAGPDRRRIRLMDAGTGLRAGSDRA